MDFESDKPQEFSSVTQCPYCQTAFHVGLAQLDVAGGRVRCGGCLRVFNAKEHFLVEQQRLFDDEPLKEEYGQATESDTGSEKEEDADVSPAEVDLFGEDMPDEDEPVILGSFNHYSGTSIPRKAILEDKVDEFRQEDYEPASAEEVLGEHQHLLEPVSDAEKTPASEPESWEEYASLTATDDETDMEYVEISATDAEEPFPETEESVNDNSGDTETSVEAKAHEPWLNSRNVFLKDISEESTSMEEVPAKDLVQEEADEDKDHTDHFFIQHSTKSGKKAGIIWWVALVLVVLALPTQLLFTQPDSLIIKSWFRQMGAVLCPHLGCPVPVYRAPDMIRISGFIEPHAEYQNSLVAKIDLNNQGLAEQPFPPVAIYFRNLNGDVTASRIFQPSDYLKGESRSYQHMPIDRNVQLELEILDPGEQSTSYELYIAN